VAFHGGDTTRVTATEIVPAGQQLDSITVYQKIGTNVDSIKPTMPTTSASGAIGGTPNSGAVIVFYNSLIPPVLQGCTPGYWKNHEASWAATGYTRSQTIASVFGGASAANYASLGSQSLSAGLSFGGGSTLQGGAQILFRAAIAAVLNAAHPGVNYPLTAAQIIADVNTALATNNRATLIALATTLDNLNNAGCPLN
jgi:hypothetical protein